MIRSLAVALDFSGKPVAWMQTHHKTGKPTRFSEFQTWEDDVPLYTAPRELSDDEILDMSDDYVANQFDLEFDGDRLVAYVRAVMNKASEG